MLSTTYRSLYFLLPLGTVSEYCQTPLLKNIIWGCSRDCSCSISKALGLFYFSVLILLLLWALLRAHTWHIYSGDYPWTASATLPILPSLIKSQWCLVDCAPLGLSRLTIAGVGKLSFLTWRWDKIWAVFYAPELPENSSWVWYFTKEIPPAHFCSFCFLLPPLFCRCLLTHKKSLTHKFFS